MNKRSYTFYRIAIRALGAFHAFPTEETNKHLIKKIIRNLHPILPGIELIRLGPIGDGGYLVPNDITGIEACFSPGVCNNSGFEKACADAGMKVFLADKSVDGPSVIDEKFYFTKKFIGATSSDSFMTMDDWVNTSSLSPTSDLLLQMDIEGFEYETFLSMSNMLMQRFRILVVEFHHLNYLWSRPFFRQVLPAFEKILQTHVCVHIHPNNCSSSFIKHGINIPNVMEFTFLRKDRVLNTSFVDIFPHPLDSKNTVRKSITLPDCWHQKLQN